MATAVTAAVSVTLTPAASATAATTLGRSSTRRGRRRRGEIATRTAPLRLTAARRIVNARDESDTGEKVSEDVLCKRIGYLIDLIQELATTEIGSRWNTDSTARLSASGSSGFAYKAYGHAFGWPLSPSGIYLPTRVIYMACEAVGRTLRSSFHRRAIIEALLTDSALPRGTDEVSVRNLRRRIEKYIRVHGSPPTSFYDLEPTAPRIFPQAILSATDKQMLVVIDIPSRLSLRIRLPLCARPASRSDWAWHEIGLKRPTHLPSTAVAGRPTLRILDDRVIADMPFSFALPTKSRDSVAPSVVPSVVPSLSSPVSPTSPPVIDTTVIVSSPLPHRRIIGLDWGVTRPVTGAIIETLTDGRIVTDGRPLFFAADALIAKISRLHRENEHLTSRIAMLGALLKISDAEPDAEMIIGKRYQENNDQDGHLPSTSHHDSDMALSIKRDRLWTERTRVSRRLKRLDKSLAHAISRWAIEQALAVKADAIAIEDLATMEAGGMGKKINARISRAIRSAITDQITYKAAEVGISVVRVRARGTSSICPRCGQRTTHVTAPDRKTTGYHWLRCTCGASLDRDHAAAERIGSRALDGKTPVVTVAKDDAGTPLHGSPESRDIGTTPTRGPRARIRRDRIESRGDTQKPTSPVLTRLLETRCARSVAIPSRAIALEHRTTGTEAEVAHLTTQPCDTINRRTIPRRLDGMRSALLSKITATPIRCRGPLREVSDYVTTG